MSIRDKIRESKVILESQIGVFGDESAVYRERIQALAENGDLALIGSIVDRMAKTYGDVLLSEIPTQEVGLARGALIALRNLWATVLQYGEDPESDPGQTTEENIYATLTELDG